MSRNRERFQRTRAGVNLMSTRRADPTEHWNAPESKASSRRILARKRRHVHARRLGVKEGVKKKATALKRDVATFSRYQNVFNLHPGQPDVNTHTHRGTLYTNTVNLTCCSTCCAILRHPCLGEQPRHRLQVGMRNRPSDWSKRVLTTIP
eukprot:2408-Prorocentrum_minimum.AAC.2